jgi:hypothetical protein
VYNAAKPSNSGGNPIKYVPLATKPVLILNANDIILLNRWEVQVSAKNEKNVNKIAGNRVKLS